MDTMRSKAKSKLDPEAKNQWPDYHGYVPLVESRREVRLLRLKQDKATNSILAHFEHASLDDGPVFEALSYCWGLPLREKVIVVNGQRVRIRATLYAFLDALCYNDQRSPIWVDALCINQSNARERSWQVSMMGQIYSKASCVKVWPSGPDADIDYALHFAKYYDKKILLEPEHFSKAASRARDGFLQLANKPYWSRLWIVQEIGLAKQVAIVSEAGIISWSRLMSTLPKLFPRDKVQISESPFLKLYDLEHLRSTVYDKHRNLVGGVFLVDRISQLGDRLCEDRRDRIFGLRSISIDGSKLVVDYNKEIEGIFVDLIHLYRRSQILKFDWKKKRDCELRKRLDLVRRLRVQLNLDGDKLFAQCNKSLRFPWVTAIIPVYPQLASHKGGWYSTKRSRRTYGYHGLAFYLHTSTAQLTYSGYSEKSHGWRPMKPVPTDLTVRLEGWQTSHDYILLRRQKDGSVGVVGARRLILKEPIALFGHKYDPGPPTSPITLAIMNGHVQICKRSFDKFRGEPQRYQSLADEMDYRDCEVILHVSPGFLMSYIASDSDQKIPQTVRQHVTTTMSPMCNCTMSPERQQRIAKVSNMLRKHSLRGWTCKDLHRSLGRHIKLRDTQGANIIRCLIRERREEESKEKSKEKSKKKSPV